MPGGSDHLIESIRQNTLLGIQHIINVINRRFSETSIVGAELEEFRGTPLSKPNMGKYIKSILTNDKDLTDHIGDSFKYEIRITLSQNADLICIAHDLTLPDGRKIDLFVEKTKFNPFLPQNWEIYYTESDSEA